MELYFKKGLVSQHAQYLMLQEGGGGGQVAEVEKLSEPGNLVPRNFLVRNT